MNPANQGPYPEAGKRGRMGMLADRIAKNSRHLRKWGRRQGFSCLRLYDHDIPEFPLSVDDYEGHILVTLSRGHFSSEVVEAEVRGAFPEALEIVFKERGRTPTESGIDRDKAFVVQEQELQFEVNLHGYQDTGLFLDHRLARAWVRQHAAGLRVLNLFCYTGSFSVAAGVGGAAQVTSVDLSRPYLEWVTRNLQLNQLKPIQHRLVAADVLQWAFQVSEKFDLIICDPPSFSNSKRMQVTFDVQRHHPELLGQLWQMLDPGGRLLFSCNDRKFRFEAELPMEETTSQTRSEDFRRGAGQRSWLGTRT